MKFFTSVNLVVLSAFGPSACAGFSITGAATTLFHEVMAAKPENHTAAAVGNIRGRSKKGVLLSEFWAGARNQRQQEVSESRTAPCTCEPSNKAWVKASRTTPKCVFIDLGAADGNTLHSFMSGGYGPVEKCPSSTWEATLVEANPRFDPQLQQLALRFPHQVQSMSTTAAYMCEGKTNFYLDTTNHNTNYWGSSLSSQHTDVQKSGLTNVPVNLVNLNKILYEKTIPGDWVMVKMDIEGAEWDVLPCLAQAPAASLIDVLYLEVHNSTLSLSGTSQDAFEAAQEVLKQRGIKIPAGYHSQTF